jgi:hypothetical protein
MEVSYFNSSIEINKDNICDKGNIASHNKNTVIHQENNNVIWSDDDDDYGNDTTLLDNFIALFNINTYLFHQGPVNKINKKLGTISFIHLNKKYAAYYSITYPKIVYNDELFDNLREWLKYIKKNNQKNIIISNFLKL